jgi:hypothetical protein
LSKSSATIPGRIAQLVGIVVLALTIAAGWEVRYLWPYANDLLHNYSSVVSTALLVLFVNLFAAALLLARKLGIAESGRMLSHVDQPLRDGFNHPVR